MTDNAETCEYLTTAEVAALLRVTTGTVRYWRRIGHGPQACRVSRHLVYPRAGIDTWMTEQIERDPLTARRVAA